MTKDTSVNFINWTPYVARIKPKEGQGYKWDAFNLNPGEEKRLTASYGGSGKYDVDADILINPPGPRNSRELGSIRMDNPWGFESSNIEGDGFMWAIYKDSKDVTYYNVRDYNYNDQPSGYTLQWGPVTSKTSQILRYLPENRDAGAGAFPRWSSDGAFSAWDEGIRFETTFFGGKSGQMRWDLVFTSLPYD